MTATSRATSERRAGPHGRPAWLRTALAAAVGVCGALLALALGRWELAPLVGWDVAAAVFVIWVWRTVWQLDSARTAAHAVREDPSRAASDILVLGASVASLAAVGLVLVTASSASGAGKGLLVGLGAVSVVLSWTVVHTVFTLRYAYLYYGVRDGGIDFKQREHPDYRDFAYVAFTVGMTFQVSDTDITNSQIRHAALRHALLSYLLGAIIVALTINLVAGLLK